MGAEDVLGRPLDAADNRIRRLGQPNATRDATFTDNTTAPKVATGTGTPGTSLLAAPADHAHPDSAPMRVAAHGITTLAAGARVTLATIRRNPNELFSSGGFLFVRDNVAGIAWENEVDGASKIGTYHERTATATEVAFRAVNVSGSSRTIEWASVALAVA